LATNPIRAASFSLERERSRDRLSPASKRTIWSKTCRCTLHFSLALERKEIWEVRVLSQKPFFAICSQIAARVNCDATKQLMLLIVIFLIKLHAVVSMQGKKLNDMSS